MIYSWKDLDLALMSKLELAQAIARDLQDGSYEGEAYSDQVTEHFVKPLEQTLNKG